MLLHSYLTVGAMLAQLCQALPSPLQSTSDGSCGVASAGLLTCRGTAFGACCSQNGICGSSIDHCGAGCQSAFGICDAPTVLRPRHHHQRHHARAFGLSRRALDDAAALKQITLPDGDADLIAAFSTIDKSALSQTQTPLTGHTTGRAFVGPRSAGLLSGLVDDVESTASPVTSDALHSETQSSTSAPGSAGQGPSSNNSAPSATPAAEASSGGPLDGLLGGLIPGNLLGGVLAETAGAPKAGPSSAAPHALSSTVQQAASPTVASSVPTKQDDLVGGLLGGLPLVGGLLGGGADKNAQSTQHLAVTHTNVATVTRQHTQTPQVYQTPTTTRTSVPITAVPMFATGSIIYQPISLFPTPTLTPLSPSVMTPPPSALAYSARPTSAMPRYGRLEQSSAAAYTIR